MNIQDIRNQIEALASEAVHKAGAAVGGHVVGEITEEVFRTVLGNSAWAAGGVASQLAKETLEAIDWGVAATLIEAKVALLRYQHQGDTSTAESCAEEADREAVEAEARTTQADEQAAAAEELAKQCDAQLEAVRGRSIGQAIDNPQSDSWQLQPEPPPPYSDYSDQSNPLGDTHQVQRDGILKDEQTPAVSSEERYHATEAIWNKLIGAGYSEEHARELMNAVAYDPTRLDSVLQSAGMTQDQLGLTPNEHGEQANPVVDRAVEQTVSDSIKSEPDYAPAPEAGAQDSWQLQPEPAPTPEPPPPYSDYSDYQNYSDQAQPADPPQSDRWDLQPQPPPPYSDYSDYANYTDRVDYQDYSDYSNHSDYSDYSDYSNYQNYSDYVNYSDSGG